MKRLTVIKKVMVLLVVVSFFIPSLIFAGDVYVEGYYRSNGTYVKPYYRSAPDGNPYNNYSYPGNTNPYTGETATGNPNTYLKNYNSGSGYNNNSIFNNSNIYGYPDN